MSMMEWQEVMTRIPDKRVGIFPLVYKSPVAIPARQPAPTAAKVAKNGLTPCVIKVTATAPPKEEKEPSVVHIREIQNSESHKDSQT